MDGKSLNSHLRQSAVEHGLCAKWQREWKEDWDNEKMVSQFYRGIDFYLGKRFVSNDFLKDNFDKDFLRAHGVLVDDTYSLLNPEHAILIGESSSTIRVNGRTCSTVYATDDSSMKIDAKGNSFILVHALGNSSITAKQHDGASVAVIIHSEQCSVVTEGDVRIRKELDYLDKHKLVFKGKF